MPEGEPIVPGELRPRDVCGCEHIAPTHASLGVFLKRWAAFGAARPRRSRWRLRTNASAGCTRSSTAMAA